MKTAIDRLGAHGREGDFAAPDGREGDSATPGDREGDPATPAATLETVIVHPQARRGPYGC